MDSSATIVWGMLFCAIGLGYIVYGKKQRQGIALLSGVALCAIPYFATNVILIVAVGILLMALPFLLKN